MKDIVFLFSFIKKKDNTQPTHTSKDGEGTWLIDFLTLIIRDKFLRSLGRIWAKVYLLITLLIVIVFTKKKKKT